MLLVASVLAGVQSDRRSRRFHPPGSGQLQELVADLDILGADTFLPATSTQPAAH